MRKTACLLTLLFSIITNAQSISQNPLVIGETISFYSAGLKETRFLNIYLPDDYGQSGKQYPVIYLLDGAMDEDFLHISGLVQFASFEWINKIPKSIVVGIANIDRKRDFTFPTKNEQDKKDLPTSGGSTAFINFIENEVQPFIVKKYRTTALKTIIGQSLGGLLAAEILVRKPYLFDNYIIVSPSLWWDDESLLKQIPVSTEKRNVYIAVGKEGEVMENDAKNFAGIMKKFHPVHFQFFEAYNHGDLLHFAVYDAFGKLFVSKP